MGKHEDKAKRRTRFKVFGAQVGVRTEDGYAMLNMSDLARDLERELNEWASSLPPGSSIRRTQLAANGSDEDFGLFALVNYEEEVKDGD